MLRKPATKNGKDLDNILLPPLLRIERSLRSLLDFLPLISFMGEMSEAHLMFSRRHGKQGESVVSYI